MRSASILFVFLLTSIFISCNAQPNTTYEIASDPVSDATVYAFYLEKESAVQYRLQQNMDVAGVLDLKIGESTSPSFDIVLPNDNSNYCVGVVAINSAGYYSGLGVGFGSVGSSPPVPGGVTFRKK